MQTYHYIMCLSTVFCSIPSTFFEKCLFSWTIVVKCAYQEVVMKITDSQHRLIEIMHEFGVNQEEIARRTGITKSAISNYIIGKREPRQDKISMISEAFGVDPAWVMGYDVPMFPRNNARIAETDSAHLIKYMKLSPSEQKHVDRLIDSMLESRQ